MAKKLFIITITAEVLYAAESLEDAEKGAERDKRTITRDEEWDLDTSEISFIPYGWEGHCIPFNSDVPLSEYEEYKELVARASGK